MVLLDIMGPVHPCWPNAVDTCSMTQAQQLEIFTDEISMVTAGVGTVHDGLWAGLHQADPDSATGGPLVDRILDCLQHAAKGNKAIYMCGHSLGGGLVSMLSLILPTRWALS